DSGFFVNANFSTFSNITFETERPADERNMTAHHGYIFHGSDNLLTGFAINQRFIHDITVSLKAFGNVISDGHGVDVSLDHYKRGPYENLLTNIDAGAGTRLWMSGGGAALGKHCGARGTFWNLR